MIAPKITYSKVTITFKTEDGYSCTSVHKVDRFDKDKPPHHAILTAIAELSRIASTAYLSNEAKDALDNARELVLRQRAASGGVME